MPDGAAPQARRLAVLGVGNELMGDEGVGVHVVRRLRGELGGGAVELIEAGTALLDAIDLVPPGADVLVIDAASGGEAPGSVYRFGLDEVSAARGVSLHESSLPEAFGVARIGGAKFGRVVVLGIEPATIEVGTQLSPTIEERVPAILAVVRREISRMLEQEQESSGHPRRC